MSHFALLWKARAIEQYRRNYQREKYLSLEPEDVPKNLLQRLRRCRYSFRRKLRRIFINIFPKPLLNFFVYIKTDQTFPNFILKSIVGFLGGSVLTYVFFMFLVFQLSISLVHATVMCSVIGVLLTLGLAFSYRVSFRRKLRRIFINTFPKPLINFFVYIKTDQTFPNFILKRIVGVLGGSVLTYAFFMFLVFQLSISLVHATIMCSVIGVLLTLGLAFSYRVRCLVFLLFPQFFSEVGRYTLIGYALILILTGPAKNTLHNSEVLSESMACGQEQLKTNVRQIKESIVRPFNSMKETIQLMVESVKVVAEDVKKTLMSINRMVLSIVNVIQSTLNWLASIFSVCSKKMGSPSERCHRALEDGVLDCQARLGAYFSWLCNVAYVAKAACSGAKILDAMCVLVDFVNSTVVATIKRKLKTFSNHVKTMLYVSVRVHHAYSFNTNSSRSASEVAAGIVTEIRHRADRFLQWFSWMSCITSLFLLIIIFRAKYYQYMYLGRMRYDNRYLTRPFRELDLRRARESRDTVLPLNRRERAEIVTTTSFRLVACEKRHLARSAVFLSITTLKLLVHMAVDHSLYWVLKTVRYHGRFEAPPKHLDTDGGVVVTGGGMVAMMLRALSSALVAPLKVLPAITPMSCLPDPSPPDMDRNMQIGILIVLVWALLLLQPYGLRLRHVVMDHYRPERARARAVWLYNHMLRRRGGFLRLARRKLHRDLKMHSEDRFTFRQWLDSIIPCRWLRALLRTGGGEDRCVLCGVGEDPHNPDTQLIRCETPGCQGVYCVSCFEDIGRLCTACLSPADYGDVSDISLEKGSSEESDKAADVQAIVPTEDTKSESQDTSDEDDENRRILKDKKRTKRKERSTKKPNGKTRKCCVWPRLFERRQRNNPNTENEHKIYHGNINQVMHMMANSSSECDTDDPLLEGSRGDKQVYWFWRNKNTYCYGGDCTDTSSCDGYLNVDGSRGNSSSSTRLSKCKSLCSSRARKSTKKKKKAVNSAEGIYDCICKEFSDIERSRSRSRSLSDSDARSERRCYNRRRKNDRGNMRKARCPSTEDESRSFLSTCKSNTREIEGKATKGKYQNRYREKSTLKLSSPPSCKCSQRKIEQKQFENSYLNTRDNMNSKKRLPCKCSRCRMKQKNLKDACCNTDNEEKLWKRLSHPCESSRNKVEKKKLKDACLNTDNEVKSWKSLSPPCESSRSKVEKKKLKDVCLNTDNVEKSWKHLRSPCESSTSKLEEKKLTKQINKDACLNMDNEDKSWKRLPSPRESSTSKMEEKKQIKHINKDTRFKTDHEEKSKRLRRPSELSERNTNQKSQQSQRNIKPKQLSDAKTDDDVKSWRKLLPIRKSSRLPMEERKSEEARLNTDNKVFQHKRRAYCETMKKQMLKKGSCGCIKDSNICSNCEANHSDGSIERLKEERRDAVEKHRRLMMGSCIVPKKSSYMKLKEFLCKDKVAHCDCSDYEPHDDSDSWFRQMQESLNCSVIRKRRRRIIRLRRRNRSRKAKMVKCCPYCRAWIKSNGSCKKCKKRLSKLLARKLKEEKYSKKFPLKAKASTSACKQYDKKLSTIWKNPRDSRQFTNIQMKRKETPKECVPRGYKASCSSNPDYDTLLRCLKESYNKQTPWEKFLSKLRAKRRTRYNRRYCRTEQIYQTIVNPAYGFDVNIHSKEDIKRHRNRKLSTLVPENLKIGREYKVMRPKTTWNIPHRAPFNRKRREKTQIDKDVLTEIYAREMGFELVDKESRYEKLIAATNKLKSMAKSNKKTKELKKDLGQLEAIKPAQGPWVSSYEWPKMLESPKCLCPEGVCTCRAKKEDVSSDDSGIIYDDLPKLPIEPAPMVKPKWSVSNITKCLKKLMKCRKKNEPNLVAGEGAVIPMLDRAVTVETQKYKDADELPVDCLARCHKHYDPPEEGDNEEEDYVDRLKELEKLEDEKRRKKLILLRRKLTEKLDDGCCCHGGRSVLDEASIQDLLDELCGPPDTTRYGSTQTNVHAEDDLYDYKVDIEPVCPKVSCMKKCAVKFTKGICFKDDTPVVRRQIKTLDGTPLNVEVLGCGGNCEHEPEEDPKGMEQLKCLYFSTPQCTSRRREISGKMEQGDNNTPQCTDGVFNRLKNCTSKVLGLGRAQPTAGGREVSGKMEQGDNNVQFLDEDENRDEFPVHDDLNRFEAEAERKLPWSKEPQVWMSHEISTYRTPRELNQSADKSTYCRPKTKHNRGDSPRHGGSEKIKPYAYNMDKGTQVDCKTAVKNNESPRAHRQSHETEKHRRERRKVDMEYAHAPNRGDFRHREMSKLDQEFLQKYGCQKEFDIKRRELRESEKRGRREDWDELETQFRKQERYRRLYEDYKRRTYLNKKGYVTQTTDPSRITNDGDQRHHHRDRRNHAAESYERSPRYDSAGRCKDCDARRCANVDNIMKLRENERAFCLYHARVNSNLTQVNERRIVVKDETTDAFDRDKTQNVDVGLLARLKVPADIGASFERKPVDSQNGAEDACNATTGVIEQCAMAGGLSARSDFHDFEPKKTSSPAEKRKFRNNEATAKDASPISNNCAFFEMFHDSLPKGEAANITKESYDIHNVSSDMALNERSLTESQQRDETRRSASQSNADVRSVEATCQGRRRAGKKTSNATIYTYIKRKFTKSGRGANGHGESGRKVH